MQVQKGIYDAFITGNVPWIAQTGTAISLNLTWDEQANADPSLLYSTPIGTTTLFSLDGGLSASAHSTRQENITFNWDNSVLLREAEVNANFDRAPPTCRDWQTGVGVRRATSASTNSFSTKRLSPPLGVLQRQTQSTTLSIAPFRTRSPS